MRLLKWLLIGLFALVVAVLVGGYVTLSNFPVEDLKALIEKETEKATGRKLTIAGDVSMEVSLSPAIVMEEVTLANAPWAGSEPLAKVKRLELQLALLPLLSSEIAVERLALVEPKVNLVRNAAGVGNWQVKDGEVGKADAADALPSFKEVSVTKAVVELLTAPGAKPRRLEIESMTAGAGDLDDALSGEMKGKVDKGAFELFFQLGSMRQMLADGRFPFFLQGHVFGAELKVDGHVQGQGKLDFTLALKAGKLEQLSPLLGTDLPAVGPLDLESRVALAPEALSLDGLTVKLGDSNLAGSLSADLSDAVPRISGNLTAKRLVPDQVFVGPWSPDPAHSGPAPLVPDVAFPMASMDLADLSLDLVVDAISLPDGSSLTELKSKVLLEERALTLAPLSFTYAKAKFDGTLHLNRRQGPTRFETKGRLAGLDYGPILGLPLRGHLQGSWDLKGEGEDLRAMVSSMRGRTRATSSDTVVRDGVLALLGDGLTQIFSPLFGGGNALTLTCVVNDLIWYGGTGRSEATAIAGDGFISTVSGKIDILSEHLDLYVDTSGRGISLSALVVPVRITGPIADPTVLPDPAGTALGAAEVAGMVLFPPLLAGDLLDLELRKIGNPAKACAATVKTIESSGGMASLAARWAQKGGDAAIGVLKDAGEAAGSVGEAIGDGVGAAGSAVESGVKDAAEGIKNLFGN